MVILRLNADVAWLFGGRLSRREVARLESPGELSHQVELAVFADCRSNDAIFRPSVSSDAGTGFPKRDATQRLAWVHARFGRAERDHA